MCDRPVPLIFLHIPKTGGTSLHQWLRNFYRDSEIKYLEHGLNPDVLNQLRNLPLSQRLLISAHMAFGLHQQFNEANDYTYTAFIREPIARAWSHYLFAMRSTRHHAHADLRSGNLSMLDYLANIKNDQCRYLAGSLGETSDEELLAAALRNIRSSFCSVGILERFDQSLVLLKVKCGWKTKPCLRLNVRPKKRSARDAEMPKEAKRLLIELNQADIKLFEEANKLLTDQIGMMGVNFHVEMILQRLSNFLGRAMRSCSRT